MRDDLFGPWTVGRRWAWAAAAVAACVLFGPAFVASLRAMHLRLGPDGRLEAIGPDWLDFIQEYSSARNALAGRPLYTPLGDTAGEYLGATGEWKGLEYNAHPPTSVLLALPLAGLSYPDAFLAWDLLTLAALAAAFGLLVRRLGIVLSPWSVLPLLTILLICNVLRQQFNQGQLNAVLLLLLVGCWAADRSGRPWLAGALLGAAAAVKLFPALLLLYYAWRREWRVVAAAAAAGVALTALTAAAFGPDCFRAYVTEVMPEVGRFRYGWLNASFTGWWGKLFDPGIGFYTPLWDAPAVARAGALACSALAVGVLLALSGRGRGRDADDLSFALALSTLTLVSPISWDHYFLLLLPAVLILIKRLQGAGGKDLALLTVLAVFCIDLTLAAPKFWFLFLPLAAVALLGTLWGAGAKGLLLAALLAVLCIDPEAVWGLAGPAPSELFKKVATPGQAAGILSYLFYAQLAFFVLLASETWQARLRPSAAPPTVEAKT
jgi:alpha-1,2-mannosyltransferase